MKQRQAHRNSRRSRRLRDGSTTYLTYRLGLDADHTILLGRAIVEVMPARRSDPRPMHAGRTWVTETLGGGR
jgi:hypothetical protein